MTSGKIIFLILWLLLVALQIEAFANSLNNTELKPEKDRNNSRVKTNSEETKTIENCPLKLSNKANLSNSNILVSLTVEKKIIHINLVGNTAFTTEEILQVPEIKTLIQLYQEKTLNLETFNQVYQTLADSITNYYLREGYITSKATINPLSNIEENSEETIIIIEGNLAELQLIGRDNLHLAYLCDRLLLGITSPLNITQLEKQLKLLSFKPILESIDAQVKASGKVGLSIIVVTIKETDSWQFGLGIDNFSPPSIGSNRTGTFVQNNNLTGWGDNISLSYYRSTTDGGNTLDTIYQLPLNPQEGTLQIRVIPTGTRITQDPLDDFNITGNKQVYEMTFRQPLWRDLSDEFALSVGFRYQNGQTLINGEVAPIENARNRSTILQFGQDYLSRDQQGFWFLRSQFNWGVDLFDATIRSGSTPDSRFFSWLFQGQRVQRWDDNHLMIIRGELQLTPDPLLPDQWFIIGGAESVRGYRQNIRFGDNGFRLSIEDRITIISNNVNQSSLEIAPFLDMGSVWFATENDNSQNKKFIMGTGLGLIWNDAATIEGLTLRLDYGIPLIPLPHFSNNLQEKGLYFQINYSP
ncbi:ShlB/FhaC/HecB family hemolysin secretion/activation protein [Cyanothece sp. BG0011]|uniref:ShlB/FhaC/HecB family hemolysin secretion/activation protein n=1 Tax=Cyanothece sp. BG0011 TaxID=2082950 RepID=UPI0018E50C65|nr:ShlB/FhaC/HecB family hemolysin secretion/activation protein [Cyanothece sp. BG0011]